MNNKPAISSKEKVMLLTFMMASRIRLLKLVRSLFCMFLLTTKVVCVSTPIYMSVYPNDTVPIGASITLTCQVGSLVYGSGVRWYLNDLPVAGYQTILTDRYRQDSPEPGTWRFTIRSAQQKDSGTWRCESLFPPSQSLRSARTQLQLRVGVPRIISLSRDVETIPGSTVTLHCNVSAEPHAVVEWRKAKPHRNLPAGATKDPTTSSLIFLVTGVQDGGVYECKASNVLGTVVGRVVVNVIHVPVINDVLSDSDVVSWINLPVNLTCAWSAYPPPMVSWKQSGVMVDEARVETFTQRGISVLQITPTTADFGIYHCSVANNRGRVEHTIFLRAAVTPSAPGRVRATAVTNDTVTLLVDSLHINGGLPVTHYRVTYLDMSINTLHWEVAEFSIDQKTVIQGLKPITVYRFKVAAGNAVGFGNYSEEVTILTLARYPEITDPTPTIATGGETHDLPAGDGTNVTLDVGTEPVAPGPSPLAIAFGALTAAFLTGVLIFLISSVCFVKWHQKRPAEEQRLCRNRDNSFLGDATLFRMPQDSEQYDVMPTSWGTGLLRGEFEFPRFKLVFGAVLGTGSFGKVVRGEADGILRQGLTNVVAIKTLKENCNSTDRQDLLKELAVMKIFKPHPNIVTLFGCCTAEEPPLIIMEYLPNGNLLQHLRNSRQRVQNDQTHRASIRTALSPTDLIRIAYEIANGMTYLASMMCIHRDLAARNILLSRDGVCKLSDFGLARDVVNGGIYQRKTQGRVPIRWMALESLLDNVYTIQSDVWSFAVLLWEIVTIGSYPFPGMSSKRLIKELQRGYRMPKPDHCSGDVYDMMIDCWREDPSSRPTFENLRNRLEAILIESRNYLVLDFDEHLYDYTYSGNSDGVDI